MTTDTIRSTIANKLKSHRKKMKMSLDAAALATGVSKAMLGQIERRESAPTIATLWKIAGGLNISFSSLFAPEAGKDADDAEDAGRAPFPNDPNMAVQVVFPFNPGTRMEMFVVTLTEGHHQCSEPHRFGVVEHVVVVEGVLELTFEGCSLRLEPGDAHRFHADVAHEYRAVTDTAAFENIICYT